jgi:hypothetical protein
MPFGMGPAGWFLMRYFGLYGGWGYPWAGPGYLYSSPRAAPNAAQELDSPRGQAEFLQRQLETIQTRIRQLEKAEQKIT